MTAPGTGSRARTREIGYAEAMYEVSLLLRAEARRWHGEADHQLSAEWRAALRTCADYVDEIAEFAEGAHRVHVDATGDFARNVGHLEYLEREWGHAPAPRELPRDNEAGRREP